MVKVDEYLIYFILDICAITILDLNKVHVADDNATAHILFSLEFYVKMIKLPLVSPSYIWI